MVCKFCKFCKNKPLFHIVKYTRAMQSVLSTLTLHRSKPAVLPLDAGAAVATAMAAVLGDDSLSRSSVIEAMRTRIDKLLSADGAEAREELAAHAVMLYALTQRWTLAAVDARQPLHAVQFQKLALSCHASYVRTLIAIEGLRQQAAGRAKVTLIDDDGEDE